MVNPPSPCSIDECNLPTKARGWCTKHYNRWKRNGDPLQPGNALVGTPEERFWHYVYKAPSGHWIWVGSLLFNERPRRYGRLFLGVDHKPRLVLAHRFAYELLIGPIPKDTELDHLCRNTLCVNPAHLQPVSHQTNILRGESNAARHAKKTSCPKGHVYDKIIKDNDRIHRRCSICLNARAKAKYIPKPKIERTHCQNGHPINEANSYYRPGSERRECKACRNSLRRRNIEQQTTARLDNPVKP